MQKFYVYAICLSLLLLTLIASACSQQVPASSNTTSTKTVIVKPTQANKGKSTPVVNITSTTVAASNVTQFVGDSFSVNVPKGWTQRHSQTNYTFSEANGVTAFFVGVHKSNQKLGNDLINKITGDVVSCTPFRTTDPKTVTINGVQWNQEYMQCLLSNSYVGVRMLLTGAGSNQTAIIYGAYQVVQTSKLDTYAQAESKYFIPMLQSFKFN